MHIIITRLPLKPDCDWGEIARKIETVGELGRANSAEFRGVSLVRGSPEEAILLVQFDGRDELDRFSREVAGPWFAENMRQYLAGPVNRTVGEIVTGHLAGA